MLNVGDQVMLQTPTHYWLGVVKEVGDFVILSQAGWVADTGRFNEATKTGTLREYEPVDGGEIAVNMSCVMVIVPWPHAIPTEPVGGN